MLRHMPITLCEFRFSQRITRTEEDRTATHACDRYSLAACRGPSKQLNPSVMLVSTNPLDHVQTAMRAFLMTPVATSF